MSAISLNNNCCNPCANTMRAVSAQYAGDDPSYTGGDIATMNEWVMAYDMDTIAWGEGLQGTWLTVAQTEPTGSLTELNCEIGDCFPTDTALLTSGFIETPPCSIEYNMVPQVTRAQYLLPFGQAYFIYALAYSISNPEMACFGNVYLSVACYSPATGVPTIVEIPIVTQQSTAQEALDSQGLWVNYILGVIDPGVSSVPNLLGSGGPLVSVIPSLAAINSSNQSYDTIGPAWAGSIGNECSASPSDPFLGDDPP